MSTTSPVSLDGLQFDNRFTRSLPADPETGPARRQIQGAIYSRVAPQQVSAPRLVAWTADLAAQLGLPADPVPHPELAAFAAGNRLLSGMDPHATCYGGHQFGNWAGQLGDGRAINLGEVMDRSGRLQMLQLKGAGPTPYSRTADGFAVLRSSVREFLCSEAMHHLGVPTTRALSLALTGESVVRDMLYDGHPAPEPGAVVCRVAPTFLRFGHYEILAARQETRLLQQLVEFTIRTEFPELADGAAEVDGPLVLRWFDTVARRTARLMVEWLRVGFVHGVMNTDNLSITGLTIDYGPYGWLEDYDPDWTPNTTDAGTRRYRFGQQPAVAHWNLVRLANALYPLIGSAEPLEDVLNSFEDYYLEGWQTMMAAKLGLLRFDAARDLPLVESLDAVLRLTETDMTLFFRHLADVAQSADSARAPTDPLTPLLPAYYHPAELTGEVRAAIEAWLAQYRNRLAADGRPPADRRAAMHAVNPKYVLRNYLAQLAIDKAENGDFSGVHELQKLLRQPYAEQPEQQHYAARRPDWARSRVGCSQLSCSS